jgi:1,4-dihydroxy-6-naphthoate synthase
VETLNQWALKGKLDVTKLSFPAFFQALDKYVLLNAGSALGKGVGPLLISKNVQAAENNEVNNRVIALPGVNTTANLLFSFAYPEATKKTFMRFDTIENYVLANPHSLGVIIHENRFTYQQKGLNKIADLGEVWERKMNMPIPLGGIAISQSVKYNIATKVDALIRKSLDFAFANYPSIPAYVKQHSQAMSEEVMRQHINLYVNNYSLELGADGKKAIEQLHTVFMHINGVETNENVFLFL